MDHVADPDLDLDLDRHLDAIRRAPRDAGTIEIIVRRPGPEEREIVTEAILDPVEGLVGDHWRLRGSRMTPDGSPNPESQLTVMSTRALAAIEADRSRWPLAGDQVYVDLDLSIANLPPGTRLAIGEAVAVVSQSPHTGCAKFTARFGSGATRWINSPTGRELRLRGVNLRIVEGGAVRTGDTVRRL
jgi:MOSC domain-containing protein YiiM